MEYSTTKSKPIFSKRKQSISDFYAFISNREDSNKYEFVEGNIQSSPKMVTAKQYFIYKNISTRFIVSKFYKQGWDIIAEKEFRTTHAQIRVPDISILNPNEVNKGLIGEHSLPEMIVEVVSDNDTLKSIETKLFEYFKAGVKIVWAIVPEFELVYAYQSPVEVKIHSGTDICIVCKSLKGLEISVGDIFLKPKNDA